MALNFPSSPSVNDTYVYNDITYTFDGSKWVAFTQSLAGSGGASQVSQLTDVDLTGLIDGNVLQYDGDTSTWVAATFSGGTGGISTTDVDAHLNVSGATTDQVLSWNGTDYAWVEQAGGSGSYDDTDVATFLNGNLNGHIIPNGNELYDLGNASNKFRHLYLSSNTMYIGDTTVTASGGVLTVDSAQMATQAYVNTKFDTVNTPTADAFAQGSISDLNALNDTHIGSPNGSALNLPVDNLGVTRGGWGQAITINGSNNTLAQMVFDYGGNGMFWRGGNFDWTTRVASYNDWKQVLTTDMDVFYARGNIYDANAVDAPGLHFVMAGATNIPTTDVHYGQLLTVHGGGDTYWQMIANFTGDDLWFRAGNPDQAGGAGTWGEWRRTMVSGMTGDFLAPYVISQFGALRLNDTYDASLTSTQHAFQIGIDSGTNLIMDNNEIMARYNGEPALLALNADGGDVTVNGSSVVTTANLKTRLGTTLDTVTKLRIFSGADLSLTGDGHGFQVGYTGATNIAMDNNEIMARNNGAASTLLMQLDGGDIEVGNNTTGTKIKVNTKEVAHAGNIDTVVLPNIQGKVGLSQWVRVYAGATGQTFTSSNGPEVLALSVASEDNLNGWDATNNWYEVPASLNGTIVDVTINTGAASSASSDSNRISLKIEVSGNAGVNWIPVASTATFDYWGQGSLSGKAKVTTGMLIRAKVGFPDEATRTIMGGSAVSINIAFFK